MRNLSYFGARAMRVVLPTLLFIGLGVMGFAGAPAGATTIYTNYVTNGSFENFTGNGGGAIFNNWALTKGGSTGVALAYTDNTTSNQFGSEKIISDNAASPYPNADKSSGHGAYFYDDSGVDKLSQSFNLAVGTYEAGFDFYINTPGATNAHGFTFNSVVAGISVLSMVIPDGALSGTGNSVKATWIHVAANFTIVTAGTYTYDFTFQGNGATAKDVTVDNVYVLSPSTIGGPGTTIPEPASFGLLAAGLAAMLVARQAGMRRLRALRAG